MTYIHPADRPNIVKKCPTCWHFHRSNPDAFRCDGCVIGGHHKWEPYPFVGSPEEREIFFGVGFRCK